MRRRVQVVDSNPYSRLLALQRMGIVEEYQKIREKTVAVVGMGGAHPPAQAWTSAPPPLRQVALLPAVCEGVRGR